MILYTTGFFSFDGWRFLLYRSVDSALAKKISTSNTPNKFDSLGMVGGRGDCKYVNCKLFSACIFTLKGDKQIRVLHRRRLDLKCKLS